MSIIRLLAVFAFALSFGTTATAYGEEPMPISVQSVSVALDAQPQNEEVCTLHLTPQVVSLLNLPPDWRAARPVEDEDAHACSKQ